MPASGLKYQARPARKKKAEDAVRLACSSFFNRFCSGRRPNACSWARVVLMMPTTTSVAMGQKALVLAGR
jgi:hypothetical protein